MTPLMRKGLLVAAVQVMIVGSLGAKLVADRIMRPRAWARTAPVDPDLPIRGRYVRLRLQAAIGGGLQLRDGTTGVWLNGTRYPIPAAPVPVNLAARDGLLVALPAKDRSTVTAALDERDGHAVARLDAPVAYFIPEHVDDPSRRAPGEELWVEVTIPRRGAPRPIRLGIKKNGILTPLAVD